MPRNQSTVNFIADDGNIHKLESYYSRMKAQAQPTNLISENQANGIATTSAGGDVALVNGNPPNTDKQPPNTNPAITSPENAEDSSINNATKHSDENGNTPPSDKSNDSLLDTDKVSST